MATRVLQIDGVVSGFSSQIRERLRAIVGVLQDPQRWVLLSCCDWYPDGNSFPTDHAALLLGSSDACHDAQP